MKTICVIFGASILYTISSSTLAKPSGVDKTNDEKFECADSVNEGSDYQPNNANSLSDLYKPRSRFEGSERSPYKPFDADRKRSLSVSDEYDDISSSVQKRQVGVIYKDDKPIGILQPYHRTYRFIPVKEENLYNSEIDQAQEIANSIGGMIDKREISGVNLDPARLAESYPSILTNFKIDNKLDKKRNYDAITDENVQDLKSTLRKLRSANPHNTEKIEEELKSILDDMGLIDDEELHAEKREAIEDQKDDEKREISENQKDDEDDIALENSFKFARDRGKRDENYEGDGDKKENTEEPKGVGNRKKRQKEDKNSELVENLKASGDLTLSGNKSPLASSEITERDVSGKESQDEDNDYDKRVERQIQSRINSLKEEVKREIEALKSKQEEDTQRKKRQVPDNLADEETDALNPAMNYDGDLKALIRKRRTVKEPPSEDLSPKTNRTSRKKREITSPFNLRKRRSEHAPEIHSTQKAKEEENDEGGELLGEDFEGGSIAKRQIFNNLYTRNKRSRLPTLDFYESYPYNRNYFYDDGNLKEQSFRDEFQENERRNNFLPPHPIRLQSRRRRRINEDQMLSNRPQQLSDMSDLDLFGALPKSYDGELSRYKRVRRN